MKKILLMTFFLVTPIMAENYYIKIKGTNYIVEKTILIEELSSCKEIKQNFPNSPDGEYDIIVDGQTKTIECLMDSYGGGWLYQRSLNGGRYYDYYNHSFSGISGDEVLMIFGNNHYSDLSETNAFGNWYARGAAFDRTIFKINNGVSNSWRKIQSPSSPCSLGNQPSIINNEKIEVFEYYPANVCYTANTSNANGCAKVLSLKLEESESIVGIGELEGVYRGCNSDNFYNTDVKFYTR